MTLSYDWESSAAARGLVKASALFAFVCLLFEEHGLVGVLRHLVGQIQTMWAGGPNPFSYPAEPYCGLVLVCSGIVLTPIMGERWFGRHTNAAAVRIAFVLSIAIGLFLNFGLLFGD